MAASESSRFTVVLREPGLTFGPESTHRYVEADQVFVGEQGVRIYRKYTASSSNPYEFYPHWRVVEVIFRGD